MKNVAFLGAAALFSAVNLAGAFKAAPTASFSEADAAKIADATQAAWVSQDVAKFEAPYSKDIVSFDPTSKVLVTTWEGFHQIQLIFAQLKMDRMTVPDRKIQLLDDATFVVSGTGQGTSTKGRLKRFALRITDVYRRQADGTWLIVTEHISLVPKR